MKDERSRWAIPIIVVMSLILWGVIIFIGKQALAQLRTDKPMLVKTVLCDTAEQVGAILSAHKESGVEAASMMFRVLNQLRNSDGEPVCAHGTWPMLIVERVAVYPNLLYADGITRTMYVLKVLMGDSTFFALSTQDIGEGT